MLSSSESSLTSIVYVPAGIVGPGAVGAPTSVPSANWRCTVLSSRTFARIVWETAASPTAGYTKTSSVTRTEQAPIKARAKSCKTPECCNHGYRIKPPGARGPQRKPIPCDGWTMGSRDRRFDPDLELHTESLGVEAHQRAGRHGPGNLAPPPRRRTNGVVAEIQVNKKTGSASRTTGSHDRARASFDHVRACVHSRGSRHLRARVRLLGACPQAGAEPGTT